MRVAGWLLIALSLMVCAALWLLPASVSVFGISGSCGAPVTTAFQSADVGGEYARELEQECIDQSTARVWVGSIAATVGVVVGGVLLVQAAAADRRRAVTYSAYPPRW